MEVPVTKVVPDAGLSITSSTSTDVVEVVLKVIVYLILAEVEVDEITLEDAVTLTVKVLVATPERLIPVPNASDVMSECLYCVPEAMFAIGLGVNEAGPGPIIRKTYVAVQLSFGLVKQESALD